MRIDFATLAFGYQVISGGNTPNWATALGQGKGHKINDDPAIDEVIKGMLYSGVQVAKVKTRIGKGGALSSGEDKNTPISLAAVFSKVFLNEIPISNGKFVLLITKDQNGAHAGRYKLKYGPSNTFDDGTNSFSNQDFFTAVRKQLGLADDACWFVSEISVRNQDELILNAHIVNPKETEMYANSQALHAAWEKIASFSSKGNSSDPEEQKEKFKVWLENQRKKDGSHYSINTITTYISQMERGYSSFDKYEEYDSIFEIQSADEIAEYKEYLFNADGFDDFNIQSGNNALTNGIIKYEEFLKKEVSTDFDVVFNTSISTKYKHNRIIFGAPGTGKSYILNKERKELLGDDNEADYERVTFHPDYSYANFVGTYKPTVIEDEDGKEVITYEYVPGPFMRVYVNALRSARSDNPKPHLLIIEEINRANVAAVFGDVFQLLDRDENGASEYPIQATEDMKKYLAKELGGNPEKYSKIRIPNNMFIWATMNSADQGVFPVDTAFKRRWNFTYIGIDDNDEDIRGKYVTVGNKAIQRIDWNSLRKAINNFLAGQNINEDKQLGPYFLAREIVVPKEGDEINRDAFADAFKSKVIMYLFEDAAKQRRNTLFGGCKENTSEYSESCRYSDICKKFDENGIYIFDKKIQDETDFEVLSY